MATWYSTGTVSVTNGLTGVTGTGTAFDANARIGDAFIAPDGKLYEIVNIASSTVISIAPAYLGTTASGQSYRIAPIQGYVKASADALKAFTAQNIEGGLAITSGGTGATTASEARTNLGLGNIDNTSDANKPISTATQTALDGKLGITATAADASKLGGITPDGYIKKTDINGLVGNLSAPLTHLPLKKNLLTAQGQSICTFTRASTATYIDRYGVLKTAAADTPRFTADGLLIEGASTNLLTYSEQFNDASWTKSNTTVSANTAGTTDPYGSNLADKLVEDSSNSTHTASKSVSVTSESTYALSIFAKAAERSKIKISASSLGASVEADLSTGTLANGSGTGYVSSAILALANGWYRISLVYTENTTGSRTQSVSLMSGATDSYAGDGTSGLYIFGAQLEAMPFATSYIPTTTASATMAAEVCSFPINENAPKLQQAGGYSFLADVKFIGAFSATDQIALGGDTSATRHLLGFYSNSLISLSRRTASINISGVNKTVRNRYAMVTDDAKTVGYVNGSVVGQGTTLSTAENSSVIYAGSASGGRYLYGTISNLRIYDRALTAEEVRLA